MSQRSVIHHSQPIPSPHIDIVAAKSIQTTPMPYSLKKIDHSHLQIDQ